MGGDILKSKTSEFFIIIIIIFIQPLFWGVGDLLKSKPGGVHEDLAQHTVLFSCLDGGILARSLMSRKGKGRYMEEGVSPYARLGGREG